MSTGVDNSSEFDSHWKSFSKTHISDRKIDEAAVFLEPVFDLLKAEKSLDVLDAGCGDGVHGVLLATGIEGSRCRYTGVDISSQAIATAKERLPQAAVLKLADVSELSDFKNKFDVAFSFGVIAYTPDPQKAFQQICSTVKENGLVGIWVYPKKSGLLGFLFGAARAACHKLPILKPLIANAVVPILSFLPTRSGLSLKNSSWKQCREIVQVNLFPTQLCFPSHAEVNSWFKSNNIQIVKDDSKNPITIWGRKSKL